MVALIALVNSLIRWSDFTCVTTMQGLKGEAGVKGSMGPFGTRGPVGQKVRFKTVYLLT